MMFLEVKINLFYFDLIDGRTSDFIFSIFFMNLSKSSSQIKLYLTDFLLTLLQFNLIAYPP